MPVKSEKLRLEYMPLSDLRKWPGNPKGHDDASIRSSFTEFGFVEPIVIDETTHQIVSGHGRDENLEHMKASGATPPKNVRVRKDGEWMIPVIRGNQFRDERQGKRYVLAANQIGMAGGWDNAALQEFVVDFEEYDFDGLGFIEPGSLFEGAGGPGPQPASPETYNRLQDIFLVPPFSVLDGRQGYWRDRKALWAMLGLVSDVSREGATAFQMPEGNLRRSAAGGSNTSIFDPVICELMYRWFCPDGGHILDPFAGGSVRGIVASVLGRKYTGVDLRRDQVVDNQKIWATVQGAPVVVTPPVPEDNTPDLSPVETHAKIRVKRDDLWRIAGQPGGKARTCWALSQGADGLVTAGSRQSPQAAIVANIAQRLGVPCRVHTPTGAVTPEMESAADAGAEVVQHRPGHNSVIISRARKDAKARGWREIPFGMECQEAVEQTRKQVANLPKGIKRLVVSVGSGMSLAGILWGLKDTGRDIPVLGVQVGADPRKRLDKYAPPDWLDCVELVASDLDYHTHAPQTQLGTLTLDAVYEAKCLPFLKKGDLLWVVGIRGSGTTTPKNGKAKAPPRLEGKTTPNWVVGDSLQLAKLLPKNAQFDFVFTCPPYGSLETYSDDPRDLSNMKHADFLATYRKVITQAVDRLKPNRFACFVVGDFRDGGGAYRNFVSDTIQAFLRSGMQLYNEFIWLTPVGSLPMRAGRSFNATRKAAKAHQNVLVFLKGDAQKATKACGGALDFSQFEGVADDGEAN